MLSGIPLFPEQASSVAAEVDNLYFFVLAVTGFFAVGSGSFLDRLQGDHLYTSLPTVIFSWSRDPNPEFQELAAAAIGAHLDGRRDALAAYDRAMTRRLEMGLPSSSG